MVCVGARRSLCQALALSVSGPGALCVGPRFRAPTLFVSGPGAVCFGARRSLCRRLALSVSGPGAVCVWPRRYLYQGPSLSRSFCRSLCRAPALSVSGRGALCIKGRSLALSVALCVGPRRSLCRLPALSVSGPGALCVRRARERQKERESDTESAGPRHTVRECQAPTQRVPARRRECRALTQRAPVPDTERRAPTQRAPGPDTESSGPRHRDGERWGPTQQGPHRHTTPESDRKSENAGLRHRERRGQTQTAPGPDTHNAGECKKTANSKVLGSFPQKGKRRAGWVARGSELGACIGGARIGWVASWPFICGVRMRCGGPDADRPVSRMAAHVDQSWGPCTGPDVLHADPRLDMARGCELGARGPDGWRGSKLGVRGPHDTECRGPTQSSKKCRFKVLEASCFYGEVYLN